MPPHRLRCTPSPARASSLAQRMQAHRNMLAACRALYRHPFIFPRVTDWRGDVMACIHACSTSRPLHAQLGQAQHTPGSSVLGCCRHPDARMCAMRLLRMVVAYLLQGALILKIIRGKYPPVIGYCADMISIIKMCLTQVRTALLHALPARHLQPLMHALPARHLHPLLHALPACHLHPLLHARTQHAAL
jgi:hypothetical protein